MLGACSAQRLAGATLLTAGSDTWGRFRQNHKVISYEYREKRLPNGIVTETYHFLRLGDQAIRVKLDVMV
jgi:hypothetical protein